MSAGRAARPLPDLLVLACADLDCDALGWLGLDQGEVHLMANAGGVVTDSVLRDIASARRALGVSRITIVQHRPCALLWVDGPARWPPDPVGRLLDSLERLTRAPLFLRAEATHGLLGGVGGELTHVDLPG